MAIDSAIKRASVINFGVPWYPNLPVPAGSVGNDDKAFTLNMYAGIAFQVQVGGTSMVGFGLGTVSTFGGL